MKNLILSVALAALSLFVPAVAHAQDDFKQTLSAATLSVYQGKQVCGYKSVDTMFGPYKFWVCEFKRQFTCTATVVGREGQNTYIGLSAGHCIDWNAEKNYYVSSTVETEPVLHNINILKSENDDRYDFVVFEFHSFRELPVIEIEAKGGVPALGTKVMTVHFAFGFGKQYTTGEVNSEPLNGETFGSKERFMVSTGTGPGASGSAIVDVETHKIIGLTEFGFFRGQLGTGAIPTGKLFIDFMDDDSAGIKPQKEPVKPKDPDSDTEKFIKAVVAWFKSH